MSFGGGGTAPQYFRNGDTTYESNERFKVDITGVTGAVLTDAQGVGIISNDD